MMCQNKRKKITFSISLFFSLSTLPRSSLLHPFSLYRCLFSISILYYNFSFKFFTFVKLWFREPWKKKGRERMEKRRENGKKGWRHQLQGREEKIYFRSLVIEKSPKKKKTGLLYVFLRLNIWKTQHLKINFNKKENNNIVLNT